MRERRFRGLPRDRVLDGLGGPKATVIAVGCGAGTFAIASLVAFVVGYISIAWLLRYLTTHTLRLFVIYRIALGVLVLSLTAAGAIS